MNCPICDRISIRDYRPFCSKRCADIDLGRWLNDLYVVPSHDPVNLDCPVAEVKKIGGDDE